NRLLDSADRGIPGLGESVIVKLLSLAHPEQWVPMFPYTGPHGKRHHLRVLGLEPPDPTLTPGELQARANRALLTDVWVVGERIRGRTPLGSYVFGLLEGPRRRSKSGCGTRAYGEGCWGWYLSWSRGCVSMRRRGRWSCRFVPRPRPAGGAGAVGSGHRGM